MNENENTKHFDYLGEEIARMEDELNLQLASNKLRIRLILEKK